MIDKKNDLALQPYSEKAKQISKYLLPPFLTAVLFCVILAIKGIYPFGKLTIDYFDMAQQITAFYYHIYDVLHFEKNLFYDQYTALSVNMAMSTSGCSQLSIFNLFFLFVNRDMLLESLSIFMCIKIMLMSLFMYVYINYRFKFSEFFKVIISVGYAFSGYVLTLYMTIQWLDIAALFPLLMLFLHKLIKDGNIKGYIVTLSLMVIASYYLSFMILIYIVLIVTLLVFSDRLFERFGYSKQYDKYNLLKLLLSTVVSLGISAFILLPQIMQTLNSARFNNESSGGILSMYYKIVSTTKPAYTSRWWTLLGTSFLFAVIIVGIKEYFKNKKLVITTFLALFIVLSELFVEGVNLFWHFGSYVLYPIRNGFIIYFTIAGIACIFIEKLTMDGYFVRNRNVIVSIILFIILAGCEAVLINCYSRADGLTVRTVFHMTSIIMFALFLAYMCLIICKRGQYYEIGAMFFVAEIILFGFIFIGKPAFTTGYTEDAEQEGEYIRICTQLDDSEYLKADDRLFNRVKNPDTSLNANYGLILRRPVLSNWTHILSPLLQRDAKALGYSVQYTRLLDSGGTVFSDMLLSISQIVSRIPMDESLYTLVGTEDVEIDHISGEREIYYIYDCKASLPFGIITDNVEYDFENGDIVSLYNQIYSSATKKKDKIAEYVDVSENIDYKENRAILTKEVNVLGNKALYYLSNQVDTDDYNTGISVNGSRVLVPSISEMDNNLYPAHFNNNALYLGSFSNESVDIEIDYERYDINGNEIVSEFEPRIIEVDLDKAYKLSGDYQDPITYRTALKNGYKFEFSKGLLDEKGDFLLLPLSYDKGYRAYVNGEKTNLIAVGGIFMAVPVDASTIDVTIKFVPDGMGIGAVISIVAITMAVTLCLIDKKTRFFTGGNEKWLESLCCIVFLIAIIMMYAVPYAFYVIDLFV